MRKIQVVLERIWKDIKSLRIAILALLLYNVIARSVFHAFCPQLILTGFPCAGCGMTRAVFYILTGQFMRGMRLNPAAPFWIVFLVWFFINRYLRGIHSKNTTLWLSLVCAITLGIYLFRMFYFFPSDPPLIYYKDNIMRRIFIRV